MPGWLATRMALVEYPEQWAWKLHETLGRQRSEEELQEERKVETRKCCVQPVGD